MAKPINYHYTTNTELIRLANDENDKVAYAVLEERAADAGCLIRDLPRSVEDQQITHPQI